MAALATVQNYIDEARSLLQDATVPYRYPDADLIRAINIGLQQVRRIRPDILLSMATLSFAIPQVTVVGDTVVLDEQYRDALVSYMVGRMGLRDQEDTTDQRAAMMMSRFTAQLLSTAS